ncbi:MAG: DEAD/DEAH box helicase family protein, partial [Bullifex sp.]
MDYTVNVPDSSWAGETVTNIHVGAGVHSGPFKVVSPFEPSGDQEQAIEKLTEGILRGDRAQTLKGVTGSGKTFTMAKVIERINRPTLILSHNKT